MTTRQLVRTLVISSIVVCGAASAAELRLPPTQSDQTVHQLIANLQQALNTGNVERWTAEFTRNARFIVPDGESLEGRDAIRADAIHVLGGVLKGANTAIRIDHVMPLGTDYALVDATHFVRSLREPPVWAIETKPGTWQHRARYVCQRVTDADWQVLGLQFTPIRPRQQASR